MTLGLKPNLSSRFDIFFSLQYFLLTRNLSKFFLQLKCFVLYFLRLYPPKGFEISVSVEEGKLDIVRVVLSVQSCHLSTQLSRSLAKDAQCALRMV